ncbi:MAG: inorganic phosphate transporter [bacterium]|nr:inorganic phosphate transporter [bacterium]
MEIYLIAIVILAALAVSDLIVGVSNDAVNFLNSSIGSRVAPRYVIMIIASLGMLAGVTFSKGMMEVARKGIFHPKYFTMPELMIVFLAVMLTDILLLDLYNTFGMPTSTTVSIVFELLGAAVAVSLIKVSQAAESFSSLVKYINTGKALAIISGILLSVVVAFLCGTILQFFSRLLFTFNFHKRLKRYGAIWGGLALSVITYFILIKGAKGSTFITPETLVWIKSNTGLLFLGSFLVCAFLLQMIMIFTKINVLKPIVLIGTFALAMAFAANDLVNFIGVPLAGLNSYQVAGSTANPLTTAMTALGKATPSNTFFLLLAGVIMVVTLWFSRKARSVTATELNLGRQDEGSERFGSSPMSRIVVRMTTSLGESVKKIVPKGIMAWLNRRFDQAVYEAETSTDSADGEAPSFDLVRASVNLVVASALISLGTSLKLPLSTTYVTFMVAMGTSFSDRAWGRDSAVYRVTGVLAVIAGWFLTAFMAFTVSAIFAVTIFYLRAPGVLIILGLGLFMILRNRRVHKTREKEVMASEIFNLKKVKDARFAVATSFEHAGYFLREVAGVITGAYEGLAAQDRQKLKGVRKTAKKIRIWGNIIVANVFKTLRLLHKEAPVYTQEYAQSVNVLQEIAECQRDAIRRAYDHVDNNHKPPLPVQLEELKQIKDLVVNLLEKTSDAMMKKELPNFDIIEKDKEALERLEAEFDRNQVSRIQDESSKTRLSILFYGFIRDANLIVDQTLLMLKIFQDSFTLDDER